MGEWEGRRWARGGGKMKKGGKGCGIDLSGRPPASLQKKTE